MDIGYSSQDAENAENAAAPEDTPESGAQAGGEPAEAKKFDLKKFLRLGAAISCLCLAGITLLFLFFTGVSVATSGSASDLADLSQMNDVNYFYYFGKAYSETSEALSQMPEADPFYLNTAYVIPFLGTLVSAGFIIAVVTLVVLTVIRGIKCLTGKSERTGAGTAITAFFVYVAGVLALFALNSFKMEVSTQMIFTLTIKAKAVLNAPTVAGITLGAIAAASCLAFKIIALGKNTLNAQYIVSSAISLVKIILLLVVAGLIAAAGIKMDFSDGVADMGLSKMITGTGTVQLSDMIRELKADMGDSLPLGGKIVTAYYLSLFSYFVTVATLLIAALTVGRAIKNLWSEDKRSCLKPCVVLAAFAAVNLIIAIISASFTTSAITDAYKDAGLTMEIKKSYGPYIAGFILSAVALCAAIAEKFIAPKAAKEEQ